VHFYSIRGNLRPCAFSQRLTEPRQIERRAPAHIAHKTIAFGRTVQKMPMQDAGAESADECDDTWATGTSRECLLRGSAGSARNCRLGAEGGKGWGGGRGGPSVGRATDGERRAGGGFKAELSLAMPRQLPAAATPPCLIWSVGPKVYRAMKPSRRRRVRRGCEQRHGS